MFTKYYDMNGKQVPKDSAETLFWVQTEIDCDLVHDTFNCSHLWSNVQVADGAGWYPAERQHGEFYNWERAQYFIGQILSKGKRRRTVTPAR